MTNIDVDFLRNSMVCPKSHVLWTFGYASLIWKPGFEYSSRVVGYIRGYKRRFYQGTTTHRGTPEWPGRVATIIPDENSVVWGVAYKVKNEKQILQALRHLAEREMLTGGYHFDKVQFYPHGDISNPIDMCVYIADPGNLQYLGDGGSLEVQAYQIACAQGVCGKNSEYVNKVVNFMQNEVSSDNWIECDRYLFELNKLICDYQSGVIEPTEMVKRSVPMMVKEASQDAELRESKRRETA